jgi:DnaK suppressor protein
MPGRDLEPLVDALRLKRSEILATLAMLDRADQPVELDQTLQGRLSRMDAITQQEMARAGRTHLADALKRIDAALARHRSGRYGLCCRCGEAIPAQRLHAEPATPFCLECLDEIAEEHRDDGRR